MKLIIMTKSTFFVEEDKIITTLFAEGMDKLHLCKPNSAPLYSERLLSLIPEDCYRKIVVHDHFYLKDEYGLGGIHIEDATAALPNGYKGHFSRSCSAIEELNEAKKKSSYVFLRNVFGNQAKGTEAAFSEEELKKASKAGYIDKKVFAIGGINIDNIKKAKDLGFGGVVICSDLWNRFDIHNQLDFKELISHFEKIRKITD